MNKTNHPPEACLWVNFWTVKMRPQRSEEIEIDFPKGQKELFHFWPKGLFG